MALALSYCHESQTRMAIINNMPTLMA